MFKFESKFNRPNERLNLQIFSIARKIWAREIRILFSCGISSGGILGDLGCARLDLVAKISQA